MKNRQITVIAGTNGAGKTTFANTFLRSEGQIDLLLNADLIAAGCPGLIPLWPIDIFSLIMESDFPVLIEEGN